MHSHHWNQIPDYEMCKWKIMCTIQIIAVWDWHASNRENQHLPLQRRMRKKKEHGTAPNRTKHRNRLAYRAKHYQSQEYCSNAHVAVLLCVSLPSATPSPVPSPIMCINQPSDNSTQTNIFNSFRMSSQCDCVCVCMGVHVYWLKYFVHTKQHTSIQSKPNSGKRNGS